MKCDAVFEGGGIRGIAYAGALEVFERAGADFQRVAGSSAGAICAAMIACGLKSSDMLRLLGETDFKTFLDWRRLLFAFDVFFSLGAAKGNIFEAWMDNAVGGRTLGETRIPLHVVTCDIRNREIATLSSESHPDLPIARAVRMSMSIPFVFKPVRWWDGETERVSVDGGLADNFPIETFDVPGTPRWPTFGFLLDEKAREPKTPRNAAELGGALVSIVRDSQGRRQSEHNRYRTVFIPDCGIDWLRFTLSNKDKEALVASGRASAAAFLQTWKQGGGFTGYTNKWRAS